MQPHNQTVASTITTSASQGFVNGWVLSPNGRGTSDILQICVTTIFLCTYSVLFLNIQPESTGRLSYFLYKAKWVLFTLFCPELVCGIAAEQWRSARQSLADFRELQEELERSAKVSLPNSTFEDSIKTNLSRMKKCPWTCRHAFFADMGGLRIKCPDFKEFPINSYQFHYLVKNNHLAYPDIDERTIRDKNKADVFARAVTLIQITWFTIQCIARGIQHLAITTFELSTIAFAYCTLHSFYFWNYKPLDVEEPIVLQCEKKLADIIVQSGGRNGGFYTHTPLDFLDPGPRLSYVEPFFFSTRLAFGQEKKVPKTLPVTTFGNSEVIPPRGLLIADVIFAIPFSLGYLGIHLAAWNNPFPTSLEHTLWRTSALVLASTVGLYMFGCWPGNHIGEWLFTGHPKYAIEQAKRIPLWLANCLQIPVMILYFFARAYIIVEGFVSLRILPVTAYASINWSSYIPHF